LIKNQEITNYSLVKLMKYFLFYLVIVLYSCSSGSLHEYNLNEENLLIPENDSLFINRAIIQTH